MIGNRAIIKCAKREPRSLLSKLADNINRGSNVNKIIQLHFTSPLTLHFTVVHESMIKSTTNASNVLYSRTDISKEERITTIIGAKGLVNPRQSWYQSANPADDVRLTANHYPQGQIGEQCTPISVDVAHFDPWKRRCWIQELVWHKWFRVRVCLPGQRVEETAAGTPGYTHSRGRDRDLTRFMYITEKRPRGRDVHRRGRTSTSCRDPLGTGYLGEIIGEGRPLAVRIIQGPERKTEKDVLNISNVSVHTEEKHWLAYSTYLKFIL